MSLHITDINPELLRQARRQAKLTQDEAAERAGLNRNTISGYETGRIRPSSLALNMLSTIYGKPVEWFFGEEEESPELPILPKTQATATVAEPTPVSPDVVVSLDEMRRTFSTRLDRLESFVRSAVVEHDAGDDDTPAVRPVEVVELAAAAGGGAEVYDETVVGRLWFRRDWLDRNAIDPKQCNVISVSGESMEPTLPDGCSILVDRSQSRRRRRNGRIFVMRTEDGLIVKRVGKDEEGDWQMVSDHPGWPPAPWPDETELIGEVRWVARTF